MKNLQKIQTALFVPKNQKNTHGNFNYRSAEDILSTVKPMLAEYECQLYIDEDLVQVGERYYIKTTARFVDGEEETSAVGYAREALKQTGMGEAQLTGSTSSYAKKYALGNLFHLDGEKDPDAHDNAPPKNTPQKSKQKPKQKILQTVWTDEQKAQWAEMKGEVDKCATPADVDAWIDDKKQSGIILKSHVKEALLSHCGQVREILKKNTGE